MSEAHALLLTDIVDSTQLTEQLGHAAMSALWAAHDHAARGLLREWRGREIDKSDGFLLLFDAVADALGFALAYHRALAQLSPPLQARAGLHHGPVTLRENPAADVALGAKPLEVDGLAKPLAARVMALALGGQTLLTEAACAALGDTTLRQQSHGHWRLKGVETAVELFEVGEAQAPFTPPPDSAKAWRVLRQGELWLPRRELQHTLPAERDSFIGRQSALQELAQRFEGGARLVSLLGTGGTGKTRLAQRYGWTWLGDYPGGVWFCDLSPASTLDGIVHAVAQGLELPLGQVDPVQQIGQAIHGRGACLVVLDNFEQVARHAEATLGQWLDRAPEARFLVTSREVLGIVGEEAMSLPPLPPEDSVTLFLRRAVAASQGFKPGPEDSEAIGPLVALLDGLPLAIELCAARVRVMPPRQLLQRMGDRFKLLAGGSGRRDRQATLRNTLDWSWDLLRQPERAALAQLSVFEGGFTIASAEAVVDLSAFDEAPWVVDVL
ncbi:AAA family ATPase, partial [Aquabacterium sp.]|uniref:AAA family ATPase n=1 Tax=Aquabacterium sp. TaxID=1872578 RepID=UPI002B941A5E